MGYVYKVKIKDRYTNYEKFETNFVSSLRKYMNENLDEIKKNIGRDEDIVIEKNGIELLYLNHDEDIDKDKLNERLYTEEKEMKYMEDVRKYGVRLARYDLEKDEEHCDTHSAFIYKYEGKIVVIFMRQGVLMGYLEKEELI